MKKTKFTTILTLASLILSIMIPAKTIVRAETVQTENRPETQKLQANYGKMPMLFEQNKGQTDKEAKFISRGKGYTLYLTEKEAVFQLQKKQVQSPKSKVQSSKTTSDNLRMSFADANANPKIEGAEEAITKTNYYIGKQKFENLSNYHKVNYTNIYKGIDAVFYGNQQNQLEYDFNVSPNADANQIKLNIEGARDMSIDDNGNLVIKTENTELIQQKPIAYQIIDNERREIEVSYKLSEGQIRFDLGEYDKSQVLTIDPVLNYLTYIGGTDIDEASDIKADANGNTYIVVDTDSLDFPTPNSRQSSDGFGVAVAKLDPNGQTILFNTFLDGSRDEGSIFASAIAIDTNGNSYITLSTESRDYPTTANAFQPNKSLCVPLAQCGFNLEAAVTKLSSNGAIVYSTYLGGSRADIPNDIAVDSIGRAYVTGKTASGLTFPKKNEYQATGIFGQGDDAFMTVFNADGSDILYSTGLGGNSSDGGNGIALDSANNAYITGEASSNGTFPVKNSFQSQNAGGKDGFVAKFNPFAVGEASLIYSTFIGGSGTDTSNAIAVNSSNQAVVVGLTGSTNFPLVNAFRSTNQINEGFVTVLNSGGNGLVNSSFLGGSDQDEANDVALGNGGLIYITGETLSNNFPTSLPFQAARVGLRDAFVTKLKFGSGIISSSYLGGSGNEFGRSIAVNGNSIFIVGRTESINLPTTSGVLKATSNANATDADGFVAKILDTAIDSVGIFRPSSTFQITQSTTNVVSQTLTFTSLLAGAKGISGDFDGDGITTTGSFSNGVWKIRNTNFPIVNPFSVTTTNFGVGGDLPIVGDWNGDGIDTIGVYRPSAQQFFLSNTIINPLVDFTINFGIAEDLPIAGDWNADGIDTIAVYRPSVGQTFFANQNILNPTVDITANLGVGEDLPIAGDWNADGKDSLGLWRPSINTFFLSDDNATLRPPVVFGQFGDQPLAGDWDGKP